jgi:phosphoribulokinase
MSRQHHIISVTGSSGAGTTTVQHTFTQIFRREGIKAAMIEGDAFHRYGRVEMQRLITEHEAIGNHHFSHFGPKANLFEELEATFAEYAKSGTGRTRHYVHDEAEAEQYGTPVGTFTDWQPLEPDTDLLSTRGCTGRWSPTRSTSRAMPISSSGSCR